MAHDLGHTPFGHAGEESLNECMRESGGFDHNIQTLRIVTLLENKYYNFKGLNLSFETIDGLIKHNGPIKDIKKLIIESIPDAIIEINDLMGDNNHYSAKIKSKVFNGLSKIEQHKLVYKSLKGKMGNELHALSITTEENK